MTELEQIKKLLIFFKKSTASNARLHFYGMCTHEKMAKDLVLEAKLTEYSRSKSPSVDGFFNVWIKYSK